MAIKAQIDEYQDRQRAIGVSTQAFPLAQEIADAYPSKAKVEDAAENRLKAQSKKKHFENKLAEEERGVKEVEDVVKVLQEEFVVSVSSNSDGIDGLMHLYRTGLKRRKSTASVLRTLARQRLLSAS